MLRKEVMHMIWVITDWRISLSNRENIFKNTHWDGGNRRIELAALHWKFKIKMFTIAEIMVVQGFKEIYLWSETHTAWIIMNNSVKSNPSTYVVQHQFEN